jgi:Type IIA topoisomerase (DNA gyrase/topo II, topoisomerase IV), A subunit
MGRTMPELGRDRLQLQLAIVHANEHILRTYERRKEALLETIEKAAHDIEGLEKAYAEAPGKIEAARARMEEIEQEEAVRVTPISSTKTPEEKIASRLARMEKEKAELLAMLPQDKRNQYA